MALQVATWPIWQLTASHFISLRDNLDLSTPSGRLMFHVVAAMAEFERENTPGPRYPELSS